MSEKFYSVSEDLRNKLLQLLSVHPFSEVEVIINELRSLPKTAFPTKCNCGFWFTIISYIVVILLPAIVWCILRWLFKPAFIFSEWGKLWFVVAAVLFGFTFFITQSLILRRKVFKNVKNELEFPLSYLWYYPFYLLLITGLVFSASSLTVLKVHKGISFYVFTGAVGATFGSLVDYFYSLIFSTFKK